MQREIRIAKLFKDSDKAYNKPPKHVQNLVNKTEFISFKGYLEKLLYEGENIN
jgi:hypothetical protein